MTNYELIQMESRNGQTFEVRCVGIHHDAPDEGYQRVTSEDDVAQCSEVVWALYGADPRYVPMHLEDFPTREEALASMERYVRRFDEMRDLIKKQREA